MDLSTRSAPKGYPFGGDGGGSLSQKRNRTNNQNSKRVVFRRLIPKNLRIWALAASLFGISILTLELSLLNLAQTRHRVRKLNAVASKLNSALTLTIPRSRNRLAFICSLRMPKVGSLNSCRRLYRRRAASVSIHCRCLSSKTSEELIHKVRPQCLSLVQVPKAGQVRQAVLDA